jgi:alpha-tubulin suppressor-like RCC1 family protein
MAIANRVRSRSRIPLGLAMLLSLGSSCVVEVHPGRVATPSAAPVPSPLPHGLRILDLQYGGSFCALRSDRRVVCWGSNAGGSLGDGSIDARDQPGLVPGLDDVLVVGGSPGAGNYGFCALRNNVSLWCWGFGTTRPTEQLTPHLVADGVTEFAFTSGWPGVCARLRDGSTPCFEFRIESSETCGYWADPLHTSCLFPKQRVRTIPRPFSDAGPVEFLSLQRPHPPSRPSPHKTCILRGSEVHCKGSNEQGALGDPSRSASRDYQPVPGLRNIVQLDSRGPRSCALRADGTAFCWGHNPPEYALAVMPDSEPCIGSGGTRWPCTRRPTPLPVADVAEVYIQSQTFVLRRNGEVLISEQVPMSDQTPRFPVTFRRLEGLPPVEHLVVGPGSENSQCMVTRSGEVYCRRHGPPANDIDPLVRRLPTRVPGVDDATMVRVDGTGACAVRREGSVVCWDTDLNVKPRGLRNIREVAGPCALDTGGRVWCWGTNSYGEMGIGRRGRPNLVDATGRFYNYDLIETPLPVPGLHDVAGLASYDGTLCAWNAKGEVHCWGPWGPRGVTVSPTRIAGLPAIVRVWFENRGQLALAGDGTLWRWKDGGKPSLQATVARVSDLPTHGESWLTNGSTCLIMPDRGVRCGPIPAPLEGLVGVQQLSLSESEQHISWRGCAVLASGELRCWGEAYCTEVTALCQADKAWSQVDTVLDHVRQVSVGRAQTCAVRTDGSVWCWGRRADRALGSDHQPVWHISRVAP